MRDGGSNEKDTARSAPLPPEKVNGEEPPAIAHQRGGAFLVRAIEAYERHEESYTPAELTMLTKAAQRALDREDEERAERSEFIEKLRRAQRLNGTGTDAAAVAAIRQLLLTGEGPELAADTDDAPDADATPGGEALADPHTGPQTEESNPLGGPQ